MAEDKKEEQKQDDKLDLKKVVEGKDERKEEAPAKEEAPKEEKVEAKPEAPKKINLIYDALLLHSAGKEINEDNVKKVAEATGASVDEAQIKSLVAALDGVDINDAISKAAVAPTAVAVAGGEAASEEKKEEKSAEEMEKKAEEAAEGLSSLFG